MWEGSGTVRSCPVLVERWSCAAVVGLVDAGRTGGEVDVGPSESARLAGARADVGSERDEGAVVGGKLGEEALDLEWGEDAALVGSCGAWLEPCRGVARERADAVVPAQTGAQRDEDVGEPLRRDPLGGLGDRETREGRAVEGIEREFAERWAEVAAVDRLVVGEGGGA